MTNVLAVASAILPQARLTNTMVVLCGCGVAAAGLNVTLHRNEPGTPFGSRAEAYRFRSGCGTAGA